MSEPAVTPEQVRAARVGARSSLREGDAQEERLLAGVVADLWQHSETLVRQEVALAKAEYETRLANAKEAVLRGAISACLYYAAYLTALATLVLVLSQWLAAWLASLIVAIAAGFGALVFGRLSQQALKATVEAPSIHPQHQATHPRVHP